MAAWLAIVLSSKNFSYLRGDTMINWYIKKRDEMHRAFQAAVITEQMDLAEKFHLEYEHYSEMVKQYESKQ